MSLSVSGVHEASQIWDTAVAHFKHRTSHPQAGPCRISRWARARPAAEAVEAAEVAPAVPGHVEEDALVAAQLYRQRTQGGG